MRAALILAVAALAGTAAPAGEPAAAWAKLAEMPADLAGREMPPGMEGAWCWVPELKSFLLYGGYSPRLTNEGWLYDPAKNELRLLWPDDSLRYDEAAKQWRVLMPRDIVWSQDRPGPARNRAAVYSPEAKKVYLFGGHPGERGWLGNTRLGTWELDPATLKFRHLGDVGPGGQTQGVYDSANRLIVAVPAKKGEGEKAPTVTWVFSPATGKWEERQPAASPRPGPAPSFAYDSKAKKCVYYTEYGETWLYDAAKNEWQEAKPPAAPPVRRHAGMCFDEKRGVTVLHGGMTHIRKDKDGDKPWAGWGESSRGFTGYGKFYNDTWTYDAAKNEWAEIKPAGAPSAVPTDRSGFAYDPERGGCVLYDVATGIWALGGDYARAAGEKPPAVTIGEEVLAAQKVLTAAAPPADPKVAEWQAKIRKMPDDSWLDSGLGKPAQGCLNMMYDPANRCLIWLGGCGGAVHNVWEDYGYNNQTVLCDLDVGRWFQRRSNHLWGPARPEYTSHRHSNGCGRGFCFDSKRKAIWTLGGVSSLGYAGSHAMQTYDVAADRYSAAGPGLEGWGSNCGLVYASKEDLVVAVGQGKQTAVFDPASNKWRKGADHAEKGPQYTNVAYDPEVGVVLIAAVKGKPSLAAFAYDLAGDKWRALEPAGEDKVANCFPGVVYDSRNRAVVVVEHYYEDQGYGAPAKAKRVWILDLAANAWKPGATSPPCQALNMSSSAYDANHNVVLLGGSYGQLMLYRWKGGCPKDAFGALQK